MPSNCAITAVGEGVVAVDHFKNAAILPDHVDRNRVVPRASGPLPPAGSSN